MTTENQAPEGGQARGLLHEFDQLLQSAERAERYLASTPLPVASDVYSALSDACDQGRRVVADAIAAQPRAALAYQQANPLGGPAKVFRAMADAIEAGDSYEDTLRRYRFAEVKPAPAEAPEKPRAFIRHTWNRSGSSSLAFERPDELSLAEEATGVEYEPLYTHPQPKGTTSAAYLTKDDRLHVTAWECHGCGHRGIDDGADENEACSACDWRGPCPDEDVCPGCGQEGTMVSACPKCGDRYYTTAEAYIAVPSPAPAPRQDWEPIYADALTLAIQRLNSNLYNLTKDECIQVVRELRDELRGGRTNSGDETGGAVKRFGWDCTGSKPEIVPATNGAFIWYDDYLTMWKAHAAIPSPAVKAESDEAEFEVWEGDELFAGTSGPRAQAWAELLRYAAQCEGVVRVFEVSRVERTLSYVPVQGKEQP